MVFKKFIVVFVVYSYANTVLATDLIGTNYEYYNSTTNNGATYLSYNSIDFNDSKDPKNIIGQSLINGSIVGSASLMSTGGVNKLDSSVSQNYSNLSMNIENISNSKFINNSLTTTAGHTSTPGIIGVVMYIDKYLNKDVNISNSLFENNIGISGGRLTTAGGAIASFLGDNTLYVVNSTFKNNSLKNIADTSPIGGDYNDLPNRSGFLSAGGAIFTTTKMNISNSNFIGNSVSAINMQARGGAIANYGGQIFLKDSSFLNNKVTSNDYSAIGGAISNTQKDDKGIGANLTIISQNKDVIFSGNTMKGKDNSSEIANDIYNKGASTINLNSNSSRKIVFNGGIDGDGPTNIININDSSKTTDVNNTGTIVFNNTVKNNTINAYGGTIQLGSEGTNYNNFVSAGKYFDGTKINILGNVHLSSLNGVIEDINLGDLNLSGGNKLSLSIDVDLSNKTSDYLHSSNITRAISVVDINGIRVINDSSTAASVSIDLASITNIGNIGTLPEYAYGVIYKYALNFDNVNDLLTFTASGSNSGSPSDFNPYLYEQSVSLRQLSNMQHYISDNILSQGLYSINNKSKKAKKSAGVWFDMTGSKENSKYDNFNTVKGNYYNALLGIDSKTIDFGNGSLFGNLYLGYLSGDHKYSNNELNSDGFYFGASVMGEMNNLLAGLTANIGFLSTDTKNEYGKDSYDNKWFSISSKVGYEFKLINNFSIEPSIYLSYIFISSDNYTSDNGIRISEDNLNSFQIAPSVALSKMFKNQLSVSIKIRYVAEIVNDLNLKANSILLPDLTDDPFVEYGIGLDKKIKDTFSFGVDLNRRDGGRRGWIGGVNAKLFF